MFSSSLTRAARTAPSLSVSPTITSRTSASAIAAAPRQFSARSHQRRYSSSKPSSPPDGPRNINPDSAAPASASANGRAEGEKRSRGHPSRRRTKENAAEAAKAKDEASLNLPSVPSTPHLHPADVAVSAFFSLHRPISITASVPSTATHSSFSTIFEPSTRANKPTEVISTLSQTVERLETLAQPGAATATQKADDSSLRVAVTQASPSNAEAEDLEALSNNSPLQFPSHLLTGRFKPFAPPPAPTPLETSSTNSLSGQTPSQSQKSYSTVLTILESTLPNGAKTYTARTSPFVSNPATPSRFLDRMRVRQERWEDYRQSLIQERSMGDGRGEADGLTERNDGGETQTGTMHAISVKRQRKLKMKKHKYKKLMRRTRNLRRRLDRN
ncbi:MAG: hypothetical protein M1819_002605 [Sarea resinae]|nr:MAG: hypothetical protein M1819_002605 [Sarea resinae]